jgi:uncharacterized iron-regulated protein
VDRRCSRVICSVILVAASLLIGPAHANTPVEKWQGTVGRNHPLTGQIWDVAAGRFIDHTTLVARLAQNRFVLLGEKHDSPDHHRLQAQLLRALIAAGRHPAVGFEMFDTDQQGAIDRHLDAARTDAAGLADAVNWDRSGWPDWSLYQPIVEVALDARLPIVATNLSPRMVSREGASSVEAGLRARLGIDRPLARDTHEAMAAEIRDSHCGYASDALIESMITVQRARDAQMAERLAAAGKERGAVLIAGVGHVRTDWGIPVYLETRLPGSTVTSVALLEVESGETEPAAYASEFGDGPLPFDYVWFTPRVDNVDPCEKFRMQLKELGKKN